MITKAAATIYYAPTKGRRYFTKSAAIRAEARAIIKKHYPDERPCQCTPERCGMCGDPGWSLEQADPERHARYMRMLAKALGRGMAEGE